MGNPSIIKVNSSHAVQITFVYFVRFLGMPLKKLYSQCREAFLVSSDLALRAQLTEFIDHKMVKVKRSTEGSEYLTIPLNDSYLQQFLDEQKK